MKLFKQLGITDRLKDPKGNDKREDRYITFRQKEFRADGAPNDPIRIVDAAGKPWDDSKLIGNGSKVDIKFKVKDYGKGKKKGIYIQAIRVLELVEYVSGDFAPIQSDDEFFGAAQEAAAKPDPTATPDFEKDFGLDSGISGPDDLDDDIPFA